MEREVATPDSSFDVDALGFSPLSPQTRLGSPNLSSSSASSSSSSSSEADPELKEVVTQSLANQGVLSSLRALVRQHVFSTINNTASQEEAGPGLSLSDPEDVAALALVREWLAFNGLEYTLNLLDKETRLSPQARPAPAALSAELNLADEEAFPRPVLTSLTAKALSNDLHPTAAPATASPTNPQLAPTQDASAELGPSLASPLSARAADSDNENASSSFRNLSFQSSNPGTPVKASHGVDLSRSLGQAELTQLSSPASPPASRGVVRPDVFTAALPPRTPPRRRFVTPEERIFFSPPKAMSSPRRVSSDEEDSLVDETGSDLDLAIMAETVSLVSAGGGLAAMNKPLFSFDDFGEASLANSGAFNSDSVSGESSHGSLYDPSSTTTSSNNASAASSLSLSVGEPSPRPALANLNANTVVEKRQQPMPKRGSQRSKPGRVGGARAKNRAGRKLGASDTLRSVPRRRHQQQQQ
jgi:hypothetical protein